MTDREKTLAFHRQKRERIAQQVVTHLIDLALMDEVENLLMAQEDGSFPEGLVGATDNDKIRAGVQERMMMTLKDVFEGIEAINIDD